MRIMQINVVYDYGSTGKIVACLHKWLKKQSIESYVCYGRGEKSVEENVIKIVPEIVAKFQSLRSRITGYAYAGCVLSTNRIINTINKYSPDVVHLHCLNGYFVNIYRLLNYLKRKNIPVVLTLHAEFMYTANCGYAFECDGWKNGCGLCNKSNPERPNTWFFDRAHLEWKMMQNAFNNFNNMKIVPVSGWIYKRAKQSPFLGEKVCRPIYNGVDTDAFCYRENPQLRNKYGISESTKILIYVTPDFNSPIKGGQYILKLSELLLGRDIKILILGYNGNDFLPDNIVPVNFVNEATVLAEYYSLADICILTSRRETYSMVCVESLCCGTPIIGFKAGGPEEIAISGHSRFVEYGDIEALVQSMEEMLSYKEKNRVLIEKEARILYSKDSMCDQYMEMYQSLIR